LNALLERYRGLPRASRWLVLFLLALGAFFFAVLPALDQTNIWNNRASTKLARLSRSSREAAELSAAEGNIKNGVLRFGNVELPGPPKERSDALNRRIGQVLRSHGVTNHTSSVKEMPLGSAAFDEQFGTDVRVERLVTELQFEASPETIAAVLADFERSPEIAAVSRVQLRKGATNGTEKKPASRTMRATLAAEAWQLVRKVKRSTTP
jgi:hypothetical protein